MFAVAVEKQGDASNRANAKWHAQPNADFCSRAQRRVCSGGGGGLVRWRGGSRSCCGGRGSWRRCRGGGGGTAGRAVACGCGEEDGVERRFDVGGVCGVVILVISAGDCASSAAGGSEGIAIYGRTKGGQ